MPSGVYISYAHEDSDLVDQIACILDELGIEYFLDRKVIQWGDSIAAKVREGLARSLAIIVVISEQSLSSYWVPFEIGHAIALGKDVLPFVTSPDLRVPQHLHDLNYVTDLDAVRDHFTSAQAQPDSQLQQIGSVTPQATIDLKVGLSSKTYGPIKATLEKLQQIANRLMPDVRIQLQFNIEYLSYERARQQFKTPNSYDIVMIDDPWVPAYADHVLPLEDEPAVAQLLEQRGDLPSKIYSARCLSRVFEKRASTKTVCLAYPLSETFN